jgi:hypothetical protein
MSPLSYDRAIQLEATAHPLANSYGDGACFQSVINMNSGQYHHRPQVHGLPPDYPYDGIAIPSSQSSHQFSSNDGLPRPNNSQQLMNLCPSNFYNYSTTPAMPIIPQPSTGWVLPSQHSSGFDDQISSTCYEYGGNLSCMSQNSNVMRDANVPRSWMQCDPNMFEDNSLVPSFERNGYLLGPTRDISRPNGLPEDPPKGSRDFPQLSIGRSPTFDAEVHDADLFSYPGSQPTRIPASESSDDSRPGSREMTVMEPEDPAVDEPYAKLIYRALMSAPGKSMVLQEIYQWFRDNTTKGSSDTKGWMNSIRHNLSMNAVSL